MSADFFVRLKALERQMADVQQDLARLKAKETESEAEPPAPMAESAKRGPGRPRKVPLSG
jgi:hypothetical protein